MGSLVFTRSEMDVNLQDSLPVGTYSAAVDPDGNFFLARIPDFTIPSKLYGNCESLSNRFLTTFAARDGTTGCLLTGEKGSGKSLVMKVTALKALQMHIPVIVVSIPLCGEGFNKFIQSIDQECVLIFDEFEKVYHKTEFQEALLTLLDGVYTTKKLVFITCNDIYRVNQCLTNRPGRMFYQIIYCGLDEKFIREYCEDKLTDKTKISAICTLANLVDVFNFDMLQAVVEEINRYGESVKEVVEVLNVKFGSLNQSYTISIKTKEGVLIPSRSYYPNSYPNPLNHAHIEISINGGDEEPSEEDELVAIDTNGTNQVVSSDLSEIIYTLEKYTVTFTRMQNSKFDYSKLL